MIGYWLVQALQNAVPGRQVACLVSRTLVSADDPAFAHPSKFVGPVYDERQAVRCPRASTSRSARTAAGGAGWCPPPSRLNCLTCPPSGSCSTVGRS